MGATRQHRYDLTTEVLANRHILMVVVEAQLRRMSYKERGRVLRDVSSLLEWHAGQSDIARLHASPEQHAEAEARRLAPTLWRGCEAFLARPR